MVDSAQAQSQLQKKIVRKIGYTLLAFAAWCGGQIIIQQMKAIIQPQENQQMFLFMFLQGMWVLTVYKYAMQYIWKKSNSPQQSKKTVTLIDVEEEVQQAQKNR
eukprot:TRINITY_DN2553_c0_g2_i1.p4 TRINITY_DN2553_c0_g2~~TRINITY_DN2553_c0_g2_i1.p4  ORF type:complete len:104 (+),score=8.76 TRINITY_DN2553_c0_g2_i1:416-727(+)